VTLAEGKLKDIGVPQPIVPTRAGESQIKDVHE